jgi:ferredoxin
VATVITSECINCGACEPECPNTAIYQGGVEWEMNGETHPAISNDIFYIVPEKCTECVGFFDQEACAAVCPVDCCVPDPNRPESEAALLERAKVLHPEAAFVDDFPSRFKKKEAPAAADAGAAPGGAGSAPPAPVGAPAAVAVDSALAAPAVEPWEIPLQCFRCNEAFAVPLQYLRAGVVFNCAHCQGSYIPTIQLCQSVEKALHGFYETYMARADEFDARRQRELERFTAEQAAHLDAFRQRLRELSANVRAPGAPYRKRSFFGFG